MARIPCHSKSCMFKVVVLQRCRICQDACHKHIFLHSLGLKCHMGIRGWYWFCVHTSPISTQSVWQGTVAITTSLWVVFLCHLPWQSPVCGKLPGTLDNEVPLYLIYFFRKPLCLVFQNGFRWAPKTWLLVLTWFILLYLDLNLPHFWSSSLWATSMDDRWQVSAAAVHTKYINKRFEYTWSCWKLGEKEEQGSKIMLT